MPKPRKAQDIASAFCVSPWNSSWHAARPAGSAPPDTTDEPPLYTVITKDDVVARPQHAAAAAQQGASSGSGAAPAAARVMSAAPPHPPPLVDDIPWHTAKRHKPSPAAESGAGGSAGASTPPGRLTRQLSELSLPGAQGLEEEAVGEEAEGGGTRGTLNPSGTAAAASDEAEQLSGTAYLAILPNGRMSGHFVDHASRGCFGLVGLQVRRETWQGAGALAGCPADAGGTLAAFCPTTPTMRAGTPSTPLQQQHASAGELLQGSPVAPRVGVGGCPRAGSLSRAPFHAGPQKLPPLLQVLAEHTCYRDTEWGLYLLHISRQQAGHQPQPQRPQMPEQQQQPPATPQQRRHEGAGSLEQGEGHASASQQGSDQMGGGSNTEASGSEGGCSGLEGGSLEGGSCGRGNCGGSDAEHGSGSSGSSGGGGSGEDGGGGWRELSTWVQRTGGDLVRLEPADLEDEATEEAITMQSLGMVPPGLAQVRLCWAG